MTIGYYVRPIRPREYNPNSVKSHYLQGNKVFIGGKQVRGADANSFEYYHSGFSKDSKFCYYIGRKLKGGVGETFKMLNRCYASDGMKVWSPAGELESVDISSFSVCDDGFLTEHKSTSPSGYAKDENHVYFYCGYGKNKIVKKASSLSFVSNNDGAFSRDNTSVFFHQYPLSGCNSSTWKIIFGLYSTDGKFVFYGNKKLKTVDVFSFKVLNSNPSFAFDENRYYRHENEISEPEFTRFGVREVGI